MLSFFEYLRERVFQAVLAGFQDALDVAEGKSAVSAEQAVAKFRQRFPSSGLLKLPDGTTEPEKPSSTGLNIDPGPSGHSTPARRGPGRPRKDEPR